jgi:hypothetical protein
VTARSIDSFPSWWRDESTLIMIDVGIDESMSPSGLLVMSAIVGNTGNMRKLDAEWKRDLESNGVEYFHAKDHWNMSAKPYNGLSRESREILLTKLVRHVHYRYLFAASSLVNETEYLACVSDRFRSQYGSPYGFAFQTLMVSIYVRLLERHMENQPINILIEDGHKNAQQAMVFIAEKNKRAGGMRVNSYGLGGKKNNPILQAADMLAFGVCEFHTKGSSDFAARLSRVKDRRYVYELPWDKTAVQAVKDDIGRNIKLKKSGFAGAKKLSELTMW